MSTARLERPARGTRTGRVLTVDDNPATRTFVRLTLEEEGHEVLEAPDARTALRLVAREAPDVVLLDLCLPDISGRALVERIRRSADGRPLAIVALTGEVVHERGGLAVAPSLDGLLVKPADPDRLRHAVANQLGAGKERPGQGRRVLLAGGEPGSHEGLAFRLRQLGFEVDVVIDTTDALDNAHRLRPDVVVAPVLGPGLSGFQLCWELRRDAALASVAVVLHTPFAPDVGDEQAAARVGASALLSLTSGLAKLEAAVLTSMDVPPPPTDDDASAVAEHFAYVERHVHQRDANDRPTVDVGAKRAQEAVLDRLAAVVVEHDDLDEVLTETLAHLLHVLGASRGIIYLDDDRGRPVPRARLGYPEGPVARPFRHLPLLQSVEERGETIICEAGGADDADVRSVLAANACRSIAATPLRAGHEQLGVLVVATPRPELRSWEPFLDAIGSHLGLAVRLSHSVDQLLAAEHVRHQHRIGHDPLTSLPNQILLADRLAGLLADAERDRACGALVLLGVDRFGALNRSLGHRAGDALLQEIAARLRAAVEPGWVLGRAGGDHFTVLVPSVSGRADAVAAGHRLLSALTEPLRAEDWTIYVTGSVGISLFPDQGRDLGTLAQRAELAMRRAKERGGGQLECYLAEWDSEAPERMAIEQALRAALGSRDATGLALHYQPKVHLPSLTMTGAEALLRWRHPTLGPLPPGRVIPVAEEAGLVPALGEWALREACGQAAAWRTGGRSLPRVAVNVGVEQLVNGDLPETVGRVLDDTGLPAQHLELEVTESAAMLDLRQSAAVLGRVRELGVAVALDDFGTGYSSLSYLRKLPVDTLKIDRSFVSELGQADNQAEIVGAVIELAHRLDLVVVAEGVETTEQLELLTDQGCDEAQGYLFGHPVPPADLERTRPRVRVL